MLVMDLATDSVIRTLGEGVLKEPYQIAVFSVSQQEQLLFVMDKGDKEVKVLNVNSGAVVKSIGRGHLRDWCLELLLAPKLEGRLEDCFLYTSDDHRVSIFKPSDGSLVRVVGSVNTGSAPGQFNSPRGMAMYIPPGRGISEGLLFVSDYGNHRVQVLNAETLEFIRVLGKIGRAHV